MLYVYAILEPTAVGVPAARGIADQPLHVLTGGPVAAAYSLLSIAPAPTAENVLRHEQVIEALMHDATLLPARFGTVFPDENRLQAVLKHNDERLLGSLSKVRGCVELGVRATCDVAAADAAAAQGDASASPGRAYMLARLAEDRKRRELQDRAEAMSRELHAQLLTHAIDGTRRVLPAPRVPMSGAYLVPRDKVAAFKLAVDAARAGRRDIRLVCTGPWPPYHFVPDLDLSGADRA